MAADCRVRRRNMVACVAMLSVVACDVPAPTQLATPPGLVVFSVLDPASPEQTVLLMQTRPAVSDTTSRAVSADDPIVSAGEIPVRGARVVLYGPRGDSAIGSEDGARRSDRLGAGVYRFATSTSTGTTPGTLPITAYLPVVSGSRYMLRVQSTFGSAEATTTVPSNDRNLNVAARSVNLLRDTVLLSSSVVQAGGFIYTLRNAAGVEQSPQYRRLLERRLLLPSGNDWAFAFAREKFVVGSRHTLTITAADSSYFGYFGSEGDLFADRTARTSLQGAVGVFGSVLLIYSSTVTVIGQ